MSLNCYVKCLMYRNDENLTFFLFETLFFMHLLHIVHSFHSFCKVAKENVGCLATGIIFSVSEIALLENSMFVLGYFLCKMRTP